MDSHESEETYYTVFQGKNIITPINAIQYLQEIVDNSIHAVLYISIKKNISKS